MNNLLVPFLRTSLTKSNRFFYHADRMIKLRNEKTGYFMNPDTVARRLIKLISLHDDVKNPDQITLNSTFYDVGLNDMTFMEVIVETEREFDMEFPDEEVERFGTINDAVEYIARSFFAK